MGGGAKMARARLEPRGGPGDDTRWSWVARAASKKKHWTKPAGLLCRAGTEIRARPLRHAARRQNPVADPRAHEAISLDAFRVRAEARALGGTLNPGSRQR
jgi:hypothetical protein